MAVLRPFANEPILELRRGAVRAGLADALSALDRTLPLRVPVIVSGSERSGEELLSTDPGAP
jgi:RHH-type transcriptional regulator, proline utilization regulon repressor / proline dehydrogenase / delta 1-pyrroline-5-carboxylate dehydrogenase